MFVIRNNLIINSLSCMLRQICVPWLLDVKCMKTCILLLFLIPVCLPAQNAPDFTITDSDGVEHSLYADYLNQGKSVLIKVFFTTCPPCRALASSMEPYYEEWGSGEYDVEFFELSDKSFDTDELVNGYKAEFGITFPSAGVDGGSLEAVAPYKAGMFGPFFGTPTFIVIAPDGSVTYDVSAGGGMSLWENLDTALYATGALKPGDDPDPPVPEPIPVTGKVRMFQTNAGIANAQVYLLDDTQQEVGRDTTDANGNYAFALDSALVADHTLTVHVEKLINPKNGITATDLLLIQKHLLGLQPLPHTEKLFASDANGTSSISAADLLFLKQLLLDLTNGFPNGDSWIFFHQDLNLGPAGTQPPTLNQGPITVQDILDGTVSPDFRGIKRGDVNDSADPFN